MPDQFAQLNLGQDAKPTARQQVSDVGEWKPSERQQRRDKVWDTWRSRGERTSIHNSSEDDMDSEYEAPSIHPKTGLPESGQYIRSEDKNTWMNDRIPYTGWGSESPKDPPRPVSYHGSSHTSWRKHTTAEWVPLNRPIHSTQEDVSLGRVHQLMGDREGTSDSRSARGLRRELPRMFKDHGGDYNIIDGNHRVHADVLAGRLFTEAYVAHPHNVPSFEKTNAVINTHRKNAEARTGYEPTQKLYNLYEGRTPDGEWTL